MINRKLLSTFLVIITLSYSSFSQTWIRCSNGLPIDTAVSSLAKIGNTLYAGTQHAGIYKSTDKGNSWVTTGFYTPVRISTANCMTSIDTFLFAGFSGDGIYRTTLNGTSWTEMNNGILKGNGNRTIFDIIHVGNILYAASNGGGVFVSSDLGENWEKLYDNLGLNDPHALSIAANSQFLFTGTAGTNYTMPDTGVAFVTPLVNGTSWSVINNGFVRNGAHLEAVSAMAANATFVYAGTDDVGIHRSTDNGQTWIQIPGTELNGDIWAIEVLGNLVYYGTLYHGIFISEDSGLTFNPNLVGLNYNGISIPDLVKDFVVLDDYIYAATTTGVYKQLLNLSTGDKNPVILHGSFSAIVYPNPFSEETIIKIFGDHEVGQVTVRIADMFGREVDTILEFLGENPGYIQIEREELPTGVYFYSVFIGSAAIQSGKLIAL